jgi:hypothetical protein
MRSAIAAFVAVLALAGCESDQGATGNPGRIDVHAGTFAGVGIGDTPNRMHDVLGERAPASEGEPAHPTGAPELFDGPTAFGGGRPFFRYESVTYFVDRRGEIAYVMVTAPGSRTERGVAIGDDLSAARRAYPELRCGTANEGSEYRTYPACAARVEPDRWVWFGGDPIANITLGNGPLAGV